VKPQNKVGATINYFFLSSLVTTLLFSAILLFYYFTGSTNFEDIALYISYHTLKQGDSLLYIPLVLLLLTL